MTESDTLAGGKLMEDPFQGRLRVVSGVCLIGYFALQLVFFFKTVALPMDGREPNITMWAVHALPLLLFLPGMLRGDYRSYTWLAFAILLYFLLAVEGMFAPDASHYYSVTIVLVIVLFTSSTLLIRWKGLQHKWRQGHARQNAR
jgi:uncharacterized membrane protein